ncbi:probable serine/threonine-protein kinase nek3 [Pararge aegeria]|uniref:probable serine/threonine-protein kinase nek3 n=1 Tax=Pararge aegeria TaxID=116150 RepID=UPI0019D0C5EF|nr:probable serine/threonine-protein kinase nek3 [Pararge aegeria]
MVINNVKESSISTSYICETPPIHNHMNTNVFSVYDASTGSITTKNPILVEIDTSKPGRYSPSPLIFTTAKIHTDSKTKLMEPVQVTPVPILSTIEGNLVKAGIASNADSKAIPLSKISSEGAKALSGKPEINLVSTCKDKSLLPTVALFFSNEKIKSEPYTTNSLDSANLPHEGEKLCNFRDTTGKPKLANNDTMTLKGQPVKELSTTENNFSTTDKVKKSTEISKRAACSKNTLEKDSLIEKSNERFPDPDNIDSKISPVDFKNQENMHKINIKSPDGPKSHLISKDKVNINASVNGNKKLQRQKNALTEAINDSVNNISKPNTQIYGNEAEKNISTKSDKVTLPKVDSKIDFAAHVTLPIDSKFSTINTSTANQAKGVCVTTLPPTEKKPSQSTISASTSKVKSITEKVNLNPISIPKSASKPSTPQTNVNETKVSTTSPINLTSTGPLINSKSTAIPVSVKPVVLSSSSCSSQSVKTDSSLKCTVTKVNTTLPSYIVSTTKTKIGSTFTSGTPAITSNPQIQKLPISVNTNSAQVKSFSASAAKSLPSTSATNGTKHTNVSKQTKSKPDTIKKDRA